MTRTRVSVSAASLARLLGAVVVIAVLWGWFLPWLATQPAVNQRLSGLDRRGIDASAMFYTELDAMNEILDRLEGRKPKSGMQRSHP